MIAIDVLIGVYLITIGIRHKKGIVSFLSALQLATLLWYELSGVHGGHNAEFHLFIDKLSVLMVCIIAIVGGAICIYAVSYMKNYTSTTIRKLLTGARNFLRFFSCF